MSTKKIIWLSLLVGLIALTAFVGAVVGAVEYGFHNSGLYKMSLDRVSNDPQVIAVIGQPGNPKWFVSGNMKVLTSGGHSTGHGDLYYDLVGPKGKCEVYVTGDKNDVWLITRLELHFLGRPDNLILVSGNEK
jgi:hypothetical protein